ncbi:MAG: SNF2-related protein [Opitutaceae bacterium]
MVSSNERSARADLSTHLGEFLIRATYQGERLLEQGAVEDVDIHPEEDPFTIFGTVRDRRLHTCTLVYQPGAGWEGQCTCRRRGCAHLYAVARTASKTDLPALRPARPRPARLSFRQEWTPILEKKLGRKLTMEEGSLLADLATLFSRMMRAQGVLQVHDGYGLQLRSPAMKRPYGRMFEGWWRQPPADPWELWQYLAFDLQREGEPIPPVFRPMTDTAGVRAAVEPRLIAGDMRRWAERLESVETADGLPRPGAERLPEVRLRLAPAGWLLESRTDPTRQFKVAGRKFLRDLRAADPSQLAHLPPAQMALVALIIADGARHGRTWEADRSAPNSVAEAALNLPSVREALAGPDGGPLVFDEAALRWEGRIDPEDPQRVRFELTADGQPVEARLVATRPRPLYFSGGRLRPGPPLLPEQSIAAAVLSDPAVAAHLRRLRVTLPEALQIKFQTVALRPRLDCWIDENSLFGDQPTLCLRLIGRSDDPRCAQTWTGTGWQWREAAPVGRPDGTALEFDLAGPNEVGRRFSDFRVQWDDSREAWTRPISRSFPEDFVAWRHTLPAETEVAVAAELKGLFEAPVPARYELAVTPLAGSVDWFDVRLNLRAEDLTLTAKEIAALRAAPGRFVRLPRRGWRRLEMPADDDRLARIGLDPAALAESETMRLHALHLADESLRGALPDAIWRQASLRAAALRRPDPPETPVGLLADLRPYQREGFHFLAFLAENNFGGVLADDMGLGKTVQALAWMLWLAGRADHPSQALVVCPKSVVANWELEAARFAPSLPAARLTPGAAGGPIPPDARIVVANYTQLRLHAGELAAHSWDAVVLDEGQNVKNPVSATARAARALPAAQRLVLTGTPIENRLLDLWSLFAFAMPGLLGSQASFERNYDERTNPDGARSRLATRVRHFLLRRTKGQVARDLPARTEEDLFCDLEGLQLELYQAELKRARQMVLEADQSGDFQRRRFNILQSLLRLRQICCDPRLAGAEGPRGARPPSAKLEALFDALGPVVAEGGKVLVFSQFVTMLELIGAELTHRKVPFLTLTGQTENRQELVDRFQTDPSIRVFLLSLKAAGSGLNLTAASYVVLYDPWWNPAVEAQAIDRTHRIGQTSQVLAYRLLARGTIEEKIRALQKAKAEMAAAVVREESLSDIMDLDTLREVLA